MPTPEGRGTHATAFLLVLNKRPMSEFGYLQTKLGTLQGVRFAPESRSHFARNRDDLPKPTWDDRLPTKSSRIQPALIMTGNDPFQTKPRFRLRSASASYSTE